MIPVLDEIGLTPCGENPVSARIQQLAETIRALDELGAPRLLRSVRDAGHRDLCGGRGLVSWCSDTRTVDRDAGLLIRLRLSKPPFVDGTDGLMAGHERERAIEAKVSGRMAMGAGLVALEDAVLVILKSASWPLEVPISVSLTIVDADGTEDTSQQEILSVESRLQVTQLRAALSERIEVSVRDGRDLLARADELLPRLRFGATAREDLRNLRGTEPHFREVLKHLRALNGAAVGWVSGQPFSPTGISHSEESNTTLAHGRLGPLRDFPVPEGFPEQRWSSHSKLSPRSGWRIYFVPVEANGEMRVGVGYVGPHLPTVKFG